MLLSLLRCARVDSPEALEEIQRFRYRIYVEELGKPLATADHARKMLVDPLDAGAWHFTCRTLTGQLVGSCRLHCAPRLPPRLEQQLGLTPFLSEHGLAVGFISKLMFARDLRGRGAAMRLLSHVYCEGRDSGAVICFNHCAPKLVPLYEKLGLYRFGRAFHDTEVGLQVPMVQVLEDETRYRSCRSPLLSDCLRYPNDPSRVRELRHWFLVRMAWQGDALASTPPPPRIRFTNDDLLAA